MTTIVVIAGGRERRDNACAAKSERSQSGIIPSVGARVLLSVRGRDRGLVEEDTMRMRTLKVSLSTMVLVGMVAGSAAAQETPAPQLCKAVHADLVEVRSTVGCKPEHSFCFLGEVDGNHGLRGTTYFKGEQGALFPPSAPDFRSYVGSFEYITANGTLFMKEMGLTNPPTADPASGAVMAYQKIISGTGEFTGATGYLMVSGFNRNQRIVTSVSGEICTPAANE